MRRYTDPTKWPRDHHAKHSAAAKKGWRTRTGGFSNPKTIAEYKRFRERSKASAIEAKAEAERREVRRAHQLLAEAQQELNRWTSQKRLRTHYGEKVPATVDKHIKDAERDIRKYQKIIDQSGGSKRAGFRA